MYPLEVFSDHYDHHIFDFVFWTVPFALGRRSDSRGVQPRQESWTPGVQDNSRRGFTDTRQSPLREDLELQARSPHSSGQYV